MLQLCEYAQSWANHLAHTNTFYYKNDRNVGHNLYCRPGGAVSGDITGQEVASYWYSAVKQYDFLKEPDVLHANVNAGKKEIIVSRIKKAVNYDLEMKEDKCYKYLLSNLLYYTEWDNNFVHLEYLRYF